MEMINRVGVLAAFCTIGCALAAPPIVIPKYKIPESTWRPGRMVAGAAKMDITPPPGYPTGGHGPAGAMARGYWTRLYARAFFFADSAGSPLVLVSSDLFAIPGGLTAEVRRRVTAKWSSHGISFAPEAIIIAATHTHQGPGNYLTAVTYNQFGSKYPGFDRELFEFLATRITQAIDSAVASGIQSKDVKLYVRRGRLNRGLVLNRSPRTFMANWNARQLMNRFKTDSAGCEPDLETGEAKEHDWDISGCPRLRAIDRNLSALEIQDEGKSVATLFFFASHPTVIEHSAPFYSGDFIERAMSDIESGILPDHQRVVAGFFNAAEGDVVPRRRYRDIVSAELAKDTLLADIRTVLSTKPEAELKGPVRSREAILGDGAAYVDELGRHHALAIEPLFGAPGFGGSEDDRTFLYDLGWREGQRDVAGEGQGSKLGALDSQLLPWLRLTRLFAPRAYFPYKIPIGYAELGGLTMVSLPVEASTAVGAMMRDSLAKHSRIEIIGLANEYVSYLASPDEYEVQDYMAASTLWGPEQANVFVWAARCLAGTRVAADCSKVVRQPGSVDAQIFTPGPGHSTIRGRKKRFGTAVLDERLQAPEDGLYRVLLTKDHQPARSLPRFEWFEPAAADLERTAARAVSIEQHVNGVWVTRRTLKKIQDTDQGGNFLTLLEQSAPRDGVTDRWVAIWLASILEDVFPVGEFRFRVGFLSDKNTVRTIVSCPFKVIREPSERPSPVALSNGQCAN
jgi:neutral ceramidase